MLFEIIIDFFKTGLFAVGGGLATVPYIREFYVKHGMSDFEKSLAISQSLPCPVGINLSSYSGFLAGSEGNDGNFTMGLLYSISASVAVVIAPVVVILFISNALNTYKNNAVVISVMKFLRPASTGLIITAISPLIFNTIKTDFIILIIYIFFIGGFLYLKEVPVFAFILFGAFTGMILKFFNIL